eukprot:15636149-Heterocapsa_arctica.AAC.1
MASKAHFCAGPQLADDLLPRRVMMGPRSAPPARWASSGWSLAMHRQVRRRTPRLTNLHTDLGQ